MDEHTYNKVYISRLCSAVRLLAAPKAVPLDYGHLESTPLDEAVRILTDAYGPVVVYEASRKIHGEEPRFVGVGSSVTERKEKQEPNTEERESTFRHQPEHRPAWSTSSDRDE